MTREEFITWAIGHKWIADKFGHFQKEILMTTTPPEIKKYRIKLSSISARHEVKSSVGWVRLRSGYFKNLSINEKGQLIGMK